MCQCPERAYFISTTKGFKCAVGTVLGVNALNGLISFLLSAKGFVARIHEMCQCPERAYFISTMVSGMIKKGISGVNALNGLISFLH